MTLGEFFGTDLGRWILMLGGPTILLGLIWLVFDDGRGHYKPKEPRGGGKRSPGGYYREDYSDFGTGDHGGGDPGD